MTSIERSVKALWDRVDEMTRLLTKDLQSLNQFHLTPQLEAYLMYCVDNVPLTATDLAREFGVSKSAISQAIAKLEADRFLEREQNPDNKRQTFIYLGPKGRMFARRLKEFNEKIIQDYYVHLDPKEIDQMTETFTKLNEIIREKQKERKKP